MDGLLASIIIFGIIIIMLLIFAINFLKSMGIEVKDFISFVKADQKLQEIYKLSKEYNALSLEDKIYFLDEAQNIFESFSKMPDRLWENQYNEYMEVLEQYQKIKVDKWKNGGKEFRSLNSYKDRKAEMKLKKLKLDGNSIKTRKIENKA